MEWLTTSTILASLRDFNNQAAWDRFVSRFRTPILRFARSIGLTENDADDVAQETLVAFAQQYREGAFDPNRGRLGSWLLGIAYRKALVERRGKLRRPVAMGSAVARAIDEDPDSSSLSAIWDREWEESLLEQCLVQVRREVKPETFKAFELAVREAMPAPRVAELLGVEIKLVYNAKHRILQRVRELRAEYESLT